MCCVAADDNPTTPTSSRPNSDIAITSTATATSTSTVTATTTTTTTTATTTTTTASTTDNKPSAGSPKLSPSTQLNGNAKPPSSPGSPNNNKHVEELYDIPVGKYGGQ